MLCPCIESPTSSRCPRHPSRTPVLYSSQPDPPTPLPDGRLLSPPANASPTPPPWLHSGLTTWWSWQCLPVPPSSDSSGFRSLVDIWLILHIRCFVPYIAIVIFSSPCKFTKGRDRFLCYFISSTILREMANHCPFPQFHIALDQAGVWTVWGGLSAFGTAQGKGRSAWLRASNPVFASETP